MSKLTERMAKLGATELERCGTYWLIKGTYQRVPHQEVMVDQDLTVSINCAVVSDKELQRRRQVARFAKMRVAQ